MTLQLISIENKLSRVDYLVILAISSKYLHVFCYINHLLCHRHYCGNREQEIVPQNRCLTQLLKGNGRITVINSSCDYTDTKTQ